MRADVALAGAFVVYPNVWTAYIQGRMAYEDIPV